MNDRRLVYDSELGPQGRCTRCGQRLPGCRCAALRQVVAPSPARPGQPRDGVVRVLRERKGRGGKVVTLVTGVPGRPGAAEALAQELRRLCGAGGTVNDGVIEVQGDHRQRVAAHLVRAGYTVKLAGG